MSYAKVPRREFDKVCKLLNLSFEDLVQYISERNNLFDKKEISEITKSFVILLNHVFAYQ